jgi:ubiquinone/menaquinone biosynthesis C-methylase UbiE
VPAGSDREAGSRRPPANAQLLEIYRCVFGPDRGARYDHTDGWFPRYCGRLSRTKDCERYVRAITNLLALDHRQLRSKSVLDLGCGFGMTCLAVSVLGARLVCGVDVARAMLTTFAAVIRDVDDSLRVLPTASQSRALGCRNSSFDIVLVVEALSHFLDQQETLREVWRVLKPGGLLIVADDNNGANPRVVEQNHEIWERFENGPPTDDIHGHRVRIPYRERREDLIKHAFPELTPEAVRQLSERTAFMTKAQALGACQTYLAGGPSPDSIYIYGRCPVEPETGQYIENLVNPLDLRDDLSRLGFDVTLEAYFGGESSGGFLRVVNKVLNRVLPLSITLRRSGGFRVRAVRPALPAA